MIDWKRVDTVLLDMDGTLLDLHFDNAFWLEAVPRRYAADRGISLERVLAEVEPMMKAVAGTLQWYCLDYWRERLDMDVVALKREYAHLIRFRPGSEVFLSALRAAGKRAVLVTNAHRDSLDLKLERVPALVRYLDCMVSSHDFGVSKEHGGFWDSLECQEGFDRERAVLLDDSRAVLDAAVDFGIGSVCGIAQPDTTRPPLEDAGYPLIRDFSAVTPPVARRRA